MFAINLGSTKGSQSGFDDIAAMAHGPSLFGNFVGENCLEMLFLY